LQPRSKETKAQILSTAYQLFSQSGYDATSVADICQAAGVSKGAFYYHFPTKQAVFLELLEYWLVELDLALKRSSQDTQSVPEAIERMAGTAAILLQSEKANLSIILEFWRQAYRDPAIWQIASAPYQRYHSFFSSLIQQGISDGSLDNVDPDLAARLFVSLALGLLMQALFDPQSVDWGNETKRSVQLLLGYLSSEAL
jgi:AcrR family transcriptional regulator